MVGILSSAVFVKLYSPEELGGLSLFLSLALCLTPLTLLRLNYALVNENDDHNIGQIFDLWVFALSIIMILLAVAVGAITIFDLQWYDLEGGTMIALLLYIALSSAYTMLTFLLVRQEAYRSISLNQVAQPSARFLMVVTLYLFGAQNELIIGYLLSIVAMLSLILIQCRSFRYRVLEYGIQIEVLARTYQRFRHLIVHSFATSIPNGIANNVMPIVVSMSLSITAAGYIFVLQSVVAGPLLVISGVVWRSIYARITKYGDIRKRKEVVSSVHQLTVPLISGFVIAASMAAELVSHYIREDWSPIFGIVSAFVAMVAVNTISNSMSYFIAFEKYSSEAFWNLLVLAARILPILGLPYVIGDDMTSINIYFTLVALVYLALTLYWARFLECLKSYLFDLARYLLPSLILSRVILDSSRDFSVYAIIFGMLFVLYIAQGAYRAAREVLCLQ